MIKSEAKPVKATKGDKATTTFKLNTPGTCNKQKKAFKYLLDYYLALVRAKRTQKRDALSLARALSRNFYSQFSLSL